MIALNFLISLVTFVVILGILVLVHEFGHYVAGRLMGFAIDAFSVGFGPKLYEKKGPYNAWQVRWLLFGGYVKFRGESGEEEEAGGPPKGPGDYFFSKKRWQRLIVMVMGVVFNVLLAYLLFAALVTVGVEESLLKDQPPRVGYVAPGLPADKVGIRSGDVLLAIDGRKVPNWDAAREEIFTLTSKPYKVQVLRGDQRLAFEVTPEASTLLKQPVGEIGLYPALPPIVGSVAKPSPAYTAGIKPDDRIASLDGKTFTYWDEFQRAMAEKGQEPRKFVLERGSERLERTVAPEWNADAGRYLVGVAPKESAWVRYPFPSCLAKAGQMTLQQSTLAYRTVKRIIERKISLSSLSGPVSIAYITGEVAKTGPYNLIMLLAVISLQLGFFNLLPIPGLDGGQILILLVESAVRRDVPMRVKERIVQVGFCMLILLFVVIFGLDVAKFFR